MRQHALALMQAGAYVCRNAKNPGAISEGRILLEHHAIIAHGQKLIQKQQIEINVTLDKKFHDISALQFCYGMTQQYYCDVCARSSLCTHEDEKNCILHAHIFQVNSLSC